MAVAAGLALALAANIRIASEGAIFGSFEARPPGIPSWRRRHCAAGQPLRRGLRHGDGVHRGAGGRKLRPAVGLVSRGVPHEALMDQAFAVAQSILRNDQEALRSAKTTVLEMIGRGLDDQLRIGAVSGYSRMASGKAMGQRLRQFYEKTDPLKGASSPAGAVDRFRGRGWGRPRRNHRAWDRPRLCLGHGDRLRDALAVRATPSSRPCRPGGVLADPGRSPRARAPRDPDSKRPG